MAFCSKCGKELAEGAQFCSSCGTPVNGAANEKTGSSEAVKEKAKIAADKAKEGAGKLKEAIDKLPFNGMAQKVPALEKFSKFANYAVCVIGVVLLIVIMSAITSGGSGKLTPSEKAVKKAYGCSAEELLVANGILGGFPDSFISASVREYQLAGETVQDTLTDTAFASMKIYETSKGKKEVKNAISQSKKKLKEFNKDRKATASAKASDKKAEKAAAKADKEDSKDAGNKKLASVKGVKTEKEKAASGMELAIVPAAEFAPSDLSNNNFKTDQNISVVEFQIARTETTYAQWYEVLKWATDEARGDKRYRFKNSGREGSGKGSITDKVDGAAPTGDSNHPVTCISHNTAIVWCNALSEKAKLTPVYYFADGSVIRDENKINGTVYPDLTKDGYRLPTWAEWYLAAKGGKPGSYEWDYKYAGSDTASEAGWFRNECGYQQNIDDMNEYSDEYGTKPVAAKKANTLGLYDMSGNVSEFVDDLPYGYYAGGNWRNKDSEFTATYGGESFEKTFDSIGFRVARYNSKQASKKKEEVEKIAKEVSDKLAANEVTVENFKIQKTELTQDIYMAIMKYNPSDFTGDELPVESITWLEAIEFCNRLSEKQGLTPCYSAKGSTDVNTWKDYWSKDVKWNQNANGWRLPTEEEWLKAADDGHKYSGSDNIDDVAWYHDNSGSKTHEVATKAANANGIYDMTGNVWEWCWREIYRGGSYSHGEGYCAVSNTDDYDNAVFRDFQDVGFRLIRNAN